MTRNPIRYALQLEMLEQDRLLGDEQATDLLRSEFALAQNAGRFNKVTAGDIALGTVSRDTPQEGVTRYFVEVLVDERHKGIDDERAEAILCQALTAALNASYFLRICDDALSMQLVARAPAGVEQPAAAAA